MVFWCAGCESTKEGKGRGKDLAKDLDITHREASKTRTSPGMISVGKRKVNQGFSKSPRFVVVVVVVVVVVLIK